MSCQIIAECCQNHNGNKEQLKKMIHTAMENGADYVKIQSIHSNELTHRTRFDHGQEDGKGNVSVIKRPYQAELERLSKLDLSQEVEAWFVEECWRAGIAPMTTVFTRSAVNRVKDLGFEAVKIASYDCASFPLLNDVCKYWSSIFVSTGSTYDWEIEKASQILKNVNFYLLHCVTIYPTPMNELHLRRMKFLQRFCDKVGYSDHTPPAKTQLWASKLAIALGAQCIERHYTILDSDQTKDGPVSITPSMLKELKNFSELSRPDQMAIINRDYPEWQEGLGQSTRPLSHAELLNRDYYRGRFASKVGDSLVYNWEEAPIN